MTPEIPRLPRISIRETNRRGLPPQRGQYDPSTPPSSCTTWGRQDPSGYLISMITSRRIPQPGEQPISCHALTLDRHCDLTLYRCDLFPPRGSLVLTDKDTRCPLLSSRNDRGRTHPFPNISCDPHRVDHIRSATYSSDPCRPGSRGQGRGHPYSECTAPSLLLLLFPDLITYHQGWYLIPWPVGMEGLEPPTSRSQTGCSDQTELHPVGGILLAVPRMPGGRVWSGAPTHCLSSPLI